MRSGGRICGEDRVICQVVLPGSGVYIIVVSIKVVSKGHDSRISKTYLSRSLGTKPGPRGLFGGWSGRRIGLPREKDLLGDFGGISGAEMYLGVNGEALAGKGFLRTMECEDSPSATGI